MAILGKVSVAFSANIVEFQKNLKQISKDINGFTGAIGSVKAALATLFVVDKFIDIGKAVFDVTAEFQKFEVTLTNTLGTQSAAKRALKEVRDFATETPFAVAEVSSAYTRWANQGLNPTIDKMRKLGDVASSLGGGFEQTAEAFKDLAVGQTKRIEELGILATQQNGKIQLSFKGVNLEIEKNAQGVDKALNTYSVLQGVFGTTAAISETFSGKISNLKDTFDNLLVTIGDENKGVIGGILDFTTNALNSFNKLLTDNTGNLIKERIEINALINSVKDLSKDSLTRNKILDDIIRKYPDVLLGLNKEKLTNEELAKRLSAVNKYYDQKIEIARQSEKVAEADKKVNAQIKYEAEQRKRLNEILSTYNQLKTDVSGDPTKVSISSAQTLEVINIEKEKQKNQQTTLELTKELEKETKVLTEQLDVLSKSDFSVILAEFEELSKIKPNTAISDTLRIYLEERNKLQKTIEQSPLKLTYDLKLFQTIQDLPKTPPIPLKITTPPEITDRLKDFQTETDNAAKAAEESSSRISSAFQGAVRGGLTDFINGLEDVSAGQITFGQNILNAISKFMASFGKQLVAIGIGQLALKAIEKIGPLGAATSIAAGAALISLSGFMRGSNSSSMQSMGSSTSSRNYTGSTQSAFSQNINVTGKLIGSGRDLVAVIGTTGFDNKYTKVP